ncbi:helix-turn-helix transcriptional regulator [Thermococcus sp.]
MIQGDVIVKNRLRELREKRGLTQEELAEALGVTRQTIIAIEKGRYNPSLRLAFRMARFFNVKIEDIFIYEGENDEGR